MTSSIASQRPVSVQGKCSSSPAQIPAEGDASAGGGGALGLNEKITLRKRLEELAAANVNTLILTEAQAEAVLGVAGQAGLSAMVEIAIDANDTGCADASASDDRAGGEGAELLRGYSALIAVVIDSGATMAVISKLGRGAAQRLLDAIVRAVRETKAGIMVGLKRATEATDVTVGDEDFAYLRVANMDSAGIGAAVCSLHERAGAHPLVIEFGEEFPGRKEAVAGAFDSAPPAWWRRRCGLRRRPDGRK